MSDGTPFLRVAAERIGAPGSPAKMPFRATNAANWSSIIRIGAKMAVIRRRTARRAVSSHTQRARRVPYGESRVQFLARLVELELIDRERRLVERRIRQAGFPVVKQLESFDFKAIPSLNKMLVLDLARGDYIDRRENVILLGPSGGKTHIALALGLAACQKGLGVRFATASQLVHELIEARDEKRLLRLQAQLAKVSLLIVDELGYVPLSQTGSELLFDVFSRRYQNGATIVTSNLPFQEWTSVFASERLTGALLDRITHHVHILGDERRELSAQAEPIPTTPVRITPRLPPWAHRDLPRAGRRQPRGGRVAPRAGPSCGLPGQATAEALGAILRRRAGTYSLRR